MGCAAVLAFPLLLAYVGPRTTGKRCLVEADAERLDHVAARLDGSGATFDAALFTYSLSLMGNCERRGRGSPPFAAPVVARESSTCGRPMAGSLLLDPAARLACLLGGTISTHVRGLCSSAQHTTCSPGTCAAGTSRCGSVRSDPQPAQHRGRFACGRQGCSQRGRRVPMVDRPIDTTSS